MSNDNTAPIASQNYDEEVLTIIPLYPMLRQSIIELLASWHGPVEAWFDTGCGTGTLVADACKVFPHTKFTLADPSAKMLAIARQKLAGNAQVTFIESDSQGLGYADNQFDIITAIQCHHYLNEDERRRAVGNCFRMLKSAGMFITFENIKPLSEAGIRLGLKRWTKYQRDRGKTAEEVERNIARFGKEYFPISILEHLELLRSIGFPCVEILWASYMQAGFYAIKRDGMSY
ncbi:MAG: class I SAM-dependent methyltransferase [Desulfobulbaceae bacterium]|jgi:tRNA (cmo5U34)-methyltransferase|nr:class I SAM-dependent methyltransferase [Desulfobulbaceae bacterium]